MTGKNFRGLIRGNIQARLQVLCKMRKPWVRRNRTRAEVRGRDCPYKTEVYHNSQCYPSVKKTILPRHKTKTSQIMSIWNKRSKSELPKIINLYTPTTVALQTRTATAYLAWIMKHKELANYVKKRGTRLHKIYDFFLPLNKRACLVYTEYLTLNAAKAGDKKRIPARC
jgi:hypothetical protein